MLAREVVYAESEYLFHFNIGIISYEFSDKGYTRNMKEPESSRNNCDCNSYAQFYIDHALDVILSSRVE